MAQRDLANILAGPCRITLGTTDLGHTRGPTRLTVRPLFRERRADALGATVTDLVHVGTDVRLEATICEWTLAGLEAIYPLGLDGGTYLGLGRTPGTALAASAAQMTLHPLELGDEETSLDVVFWKAVADGAVAVAFGPEEDRVFETAFRILPDLTRDAGEELGRIGAP